jgi:hypothetical protein
MSPVWLKAWKVKAARAAEKRPCCEESPFGTLESALETSEGSIGIEDRVKETNGIVEDDSVIGLDAELG